VVVLFVGETGGEKLFKRRGGRMGLICFSTGLGLEESLDHRDDEEEDELLL